MEWERLPPHALFRGPSFVYNNRRRSINADMHWIERTVVINNGQDEQEIAKQWDLLGLEYEYD